MSKLFGASLLLILRSTMALQDKKCSFDNFPKQLESCSCEVVDKKVVSVNCVDLGFRTTDGLGQLPDSVERVTFTGNNLTELREDIFDGHSPVHLQHVDLSNNSISYIDPNAFKSMYQVTSLTLKKNDWEAQENSTVFQSTPKLQQLDLGGTLAKFFRNGTNYVNRLNWIFGDAVLGDLEELHLEDNLLLFYHPEAFQGMPNLKKLYLSNNKISVPLIRSKYMGNLEELHLDNNTIEWIDDNELVGLRNMTKLKIFNISLNPFECSCLSRNFLRWMQLNDDNQKVVNYTELTCQSPEKQLNQSLITVDLTKLDQTPCRRQPANRVYNASYAIIGFLLFATFVFTLICILRHRSRIQKTFKNIANYGCCGGRFRAGDSEDYGSYQTVEDEDVVFQKDRA